MTWTFGLLGATAGVFAMSAAALWDILAGHGPLVTMVLPYTDMEHRVSPRSFFWPPCCSPACRWRCCWRGRKSF